MPKRQRQKKTRRLGSTPHVPSPGPATCSPLSTRLTRRNSSTRCLPQKAIAKVVGTTSRHSGGASGGGGEQSSLEALAKELGCKSDDERCIVEKSLLSHREKKALLDTYFRPEMPKEWKGDPDMWLSSEDIGVVMKQYEKAYPEFKFLGVVPIDFSAPDPYVKDQPKKCMNDRFCHVDLAAEKAAGRRILGAVFNLDPHYKDGSHWVAMAIDLARDCAYYFDSYGMAPPEQVARFMRYLTTQNPKLRLERNGRRFQYSDSECGMYSMYFLIRMIAGESFKKFCKKRIADKYMLEFRKVLFDPED